MNYKHDPFIKMGNLTCAAVPPHHLKLGFKHHHSCTHKKNPLSHTSALINWHLIWWQIFSLFHFLLVKNTKQFLTNKNKY